MGKLRGTQGVVPPFLKSPKCLSSLQGNLISQHRLDCHAEYRSYHGGTCLSSVAPRENDTDPFVNLMGSQTLLPQLGRIAKGHVSPRVEV